MKEQLRRRLETLKSEFEAGQKMLADLEAQQLRVKETVWRISGAIQVLEEELAKADCEVNGAIAEQFYRREETMG
ncbi:MAG: hypothetical protein ACM37W_17915 [Actinomycetota bacterium]